MQADQGIHCMQMPEDAFFNVGGGTFLFPLLSTPAFYINMAVNILMDIFLL